MLRSIYPGLLQKFFNLVDEIMEGDVAIEYGEIENGNIEFNIEKSS